MRGKKQTWFIFYFTSFLFFLRAGVSSTFYGLAVVALAVVADCGEPSVARVVLWACDSLCYCCLGALTFTPSASFKNHLCLLRNEVGDDR